MTTTTTTTTTGSLTERAMLVSLHVSRWGGTTKDRRIERKIEQENGATKRVGQYQKFLVARESLQTLSQLESEARRILYTYTLPWTNDGGRILSSAGYFEFNRVITEVREKFERAADEFERAYPRYIQEFRAAIDNPDEFLPESEYPSAGRIRDRFGFKISIRPLSTSEDFRVKLGDDEMARLRADYATSTEDAINDAMREVWSRFETVISHMSERLTAYRVTTNGKTKVENPFRDSLVSNIRELLDMVPILNIADDPKVSEFAERIRESLCKYEAQELRDSEPTRKAVAAEADSILAQMQEFIA